MEIFKNKSSTKTSKKYPRKRIVLLFVAVVMIIIFFWNPNLIKFEDDAPIPISRIDKEIENGIHIVTGLIDADDLNTVIANCTGCHSAQLVIQNRMNKERWNATIRWMQETQNLWPLGDNQEVIVDYLVNNYPPTQKGRRANLEKVEWFELEKENTKLEVRSKK